MNRMAILLALLAFSGLSVCAAEFNTALSDGLEIGDRAPAIQGSEWVGSGGRAPDLKNKVVLVDFWYAGCPTCVHKMPEVAALAERYRKDGLIVIGPSLDEAPTVQKFRELHGGSYPFLAGALNMAKAFKITGFPTMVLIGKNGRVLWRANFKDETLAPAIEAALRR
jgi:thiol-disulfide isomerase/thioredoxin